MVEGIINNFDNLSESEIDRLVNKYSQIAEKTLNLTYDREKRTIIKTAVEEMNKNIWKINPDFHIRGKVIRLYGVKKRRFFWWNYYRDLFPELDYNKEKFKEFLMFDVDIHDPDSLEIKELFLGPKAFEIQKLDKILGKDAPHNFSYAVLKAINEGINTNEKLNTHFKYLFGPEHHHLISLAISQKNISEALKFLKSKNLISKVNGKYKITYLGNKANFEANFELRHELYWVKRFLTEKMTIILSFTVLVILASLKIIFGLLLPSDGLFNDGIENLTDVIKVIIILLSIRYNKDRLGSIGIMIMMLITGFTLGYGAILELLTPESYSNIFEWINVQFQLTKQFNIIGFLIAGFSIFLNIGLWQMKFMVGKRSGNLSILSDAKDSVNNTYIGIGVIIGLFFENFLGISILDILVGLVISIIIMYDGMETLTELISKGENIDIDAIRVAGDNRYLDRISYWIIINVEREEFTPEGLNTAFLKGLELGYRYYGEFAVIGYHNLSEKGCHKNLQVLSNEGIIKKENDKLYLTDKGRIKFNQKMKRLDKKLLKDTKYHYNKFLEVIKKIVGLVIIIGIIILIIFFY